MIKEGTAKRAVRNKKDSTLKNNAKGPWPKDVPAKMLLFQFNAMGTAARPNVQTTISAARCLDFSCSYLFMVVLWFYMEEEQFVLHTINSWAVLCLNSSTQACPD